VGTGVGEEIIGEYVAPVLQAVKHNIPITLTSMLRPCFMA
jgi:hypothetical protein